MDPKSPFQVPDDQLEQRLRAEGFNRHNAELDVQQDASGTWRAGFMLHTTEPTLGALGTALTQPTTGETRRAALEQLWLSLDLEDDLRSMRRLG
jgi:hypothetical protein